jgi:hypothetical protein
MARPKKQTVDYFPHIIKQGKTMTILENKFGNDGYAFWFKLLEILGSTNGHFYEYKNTADKEFLHAKTLVSEDIAKEILNLLAELNAIDQELWEHNIIWCSNFVDNIEDAYSRRKVNVPHKPIVSEVNVNRNPSEGDKCSHDDDINSQSKVKESKVNKSKGKPSEKSDTESDEFSLTKKDSGRYDYPKDYERLYSLYPYSRGNKKAGWRKWAATRRKNVSQDDLLEAVKSYAAKCKKDGTEKKWVMHIKKFFGPDEYWKEYLGGNDNGGEFQANNQSEEEKLGAEVDELFDQD